jgi:hypothetical protein
MVVFDGVSKAVISKCVHHDEATHVNMAQYLGVSDRRAALVQRCRSLNSQTSSNHSARTASACFLTKDRFDPAWTALLR